MLLSAIFISIREHICKSISPAKATKTPRTHLIATNWRQLDNFVWSDSVKWHIFTNFQMPKSLQWSGPSPQAHTHKDQINSNQLKRQPQSILKFLWGGRVYILCKFQLPSDGFGSNSVNTSSHAISSADIFYLARITHENPVELGKRMRRRWKHCNMAIPFRSRSHLKGLYWLPSACRLPCSICYWDVLPGGSVLFSSVQFSSVQLSWLHFAVNKVRDAQDTAGLAAGIGPPL